MGEQFTQEQLSQLKVGQVISLESLRGLYCRKGTGTTYEALNPEEFHGDYGKVSKVTSRMVKVDIDKMRPKPSKKTFNSPRYFHLFHLREPRK